ncbi:hypothetical protein GIB67_030098, partial [Kingdonia uniflora]
LWPCFLQQTREMALRHSIPLFLSLKPSLPPTQRRTISQSSSFSVSAMASALKKVLSLSPYNNTFRSSNCRSLKQVLVPIANGTEPMEAVIIVDVLRRAGAEVTVASVEKDLRADASWGLKLIADTLIADCTQTTFDLISLPGGMPGASTLRDCELLENLVKKHAADGRIYAAVCAAPAVTLGPWGLLKGLKATCHPSVMDKLSLFSTAVEARFYHDGQSVTSRGPGTTMEFSLALVERLYGIDKVIEIAGPMVCRFCFMHYSLVNQMFLYCMRGFTRQEVFGIWCV